MFVLILAWLIGGYMHRVGLNLYTVCTYTCVVCAFVHVCTNAVHVGSFFFLCLSAVIFGTDRNIYTLKHLVAG